MKESSLKARPPARRVVVEVHLPYDVAVSNDDEYADDQADPLFQANPVTVRTLLSHVHARELAIPDFQRDFVWEVDKTRQLLSSIMSRYPAGTLLFLKISEGTEFFRPRQVEGAPVLNATRPRELVLDGQQRITGLYQAMYGRSDHRFFVDFSKLRSDDGSVPEPEQVKFDEVVVAVPRGEGGATRFDDDETQLEKWLYPIDRYYIENHLDDWLDVLCEHHAATAEGQNALKSELRKLRSRYLTRLALYAFPVVRLEETTSLAAICTIFETINRQGVPLSVFELLTARFWPQNVNLRDLWQAAQDQYDIIDEFDIDPYAILQAVTLRASSSAQRSEVLLLESASIEQYWDEVVRGFAGALGLLKNECGVLTTKLLPYGMVLVPLAAVWHRVEETKGAERGKALEKLQRYFWCTVFTGNFDQGANSQAGRDYADLDAWLESDDASAPEAVAQFFLSAQQLMLATVKRRALYAGMLALSVTHGGKDFHTSQKLTTTQMQNQKIDAHHLFPRKWLTDNYVAGLVDARGDEVALGTELILNRALIDKETNQRIRARAPSVYLAEIRDIRGEGALNEILDSHLLPNEEGAGLFEDDYERFILNRLELVLGQIEAVTSKPVSKDVDLRSAVDAAAAAAE